MLSHKLVAAELKLCRRVGSILERMLPKAQTMVEMSRLFSSSTIWPA